VKNYIFSCYPSAKKTHLNNNSVWILIQVRSCHRFVHIKLTQSNAAVEKYSDRLQRSVMS